MLNYAFGLTRIKLGRFALASFIAMAPGAAAYAYLGHAGQQLAAGTEDAIRTALIALGALAALGLVTTVVKRYWRHKPDFIGQGELDEMIESHEEVGVLDVRSEEEFRGPLGSIDGARNIPVDELGERLEELSDWRDIPVVTVCRTERRSATAARVLASEGFENIQVLAGGMQERSERL